MSPSRKASNAILREWAKAITGRVLSIGSGEDSDKDGSTYRAYFCNAQSYHTSEPYYSDKCDLVVDVRDMTNIDGQSYDSIFCIGVLEHVDDCHAAVANCFLALRTGGVFIVGVPFAQPIHRAPQDFWRFTEFGVRYLLRPFDIEELHPIGDPGYPTTYLVKARKA